MSGVPNRSAELPIIGFVGALHYQRRQICVSWFKGDRELSAHYQKSGGERLQGSNASVFAAGSMAAWHGALPPAGSAGGPIFWRNDLWSEKSLAAFGSAFRFHLNVHKDCGKRPNNCETLRFAALLSQGASVISEGCHPADEAEWAAVGVRFAKSPNKLPRLFLRAWTERGALPPRQEVAAAFATKFAPETIARRAGLVELLRELRLRWILR